MYKDYVIGWLQNLCLKLDLVGERVIYRYEMFYFPCIIFVEKIKIPVSY